MTGESVRDLADSYLDAVSELDPLIATWVGLRPDDAGVPDLSPDGRRAKDELCRATLAKLATLTAENPADRRCATLLEERLTTELAVSASGEHLREMSNILGPIHDLRVTFTMMATETPDDWAVIAGRLARVPEALAGYRASLAEGVRRGLLAAPLQVETFAGQLAEWVRTNWFVTFAAPAPEAVRAAERATAAVAEFRDWLVTEYLPRADGTPDGVGADRYRLLARQWLGASVDPVEVYEWGWAEYRELTAELRAQIDAILPGATLAEAGAHLDAHGEVVEGVEQIRLRLQELIDQRMAELDGTHFDLAGPIRRLDACIAPEGSAAAPYYVEPTQDFSRPGRTYLPTLGQTRFPLWKLVTTWHHEGVPGHHLQHATWATQWRDLSRYQTCGLGSISACSEGWALYAERLMDEFGYLDPGARLGYLSGQVRRAIRVIVDIGLHLGLDLPADAPVGAGETWTPALARDFFASGTVHGNSYVDSEIVRYLGIPGQAISYKVGERAWLAGRAAARQARGQDFDLKSWHMSALALGSLGLDGLAGELAAL